MKRIFLFAASVFMVGATYAQGELDAYRFSRNDLTGTARSVSMGGAFGALGGDISGVAINPAGIGVYKSSEIVTTLNFENTKTETNLNAGKLNEGKFRVNFDNLAFVSSIPLYNDVAPFLNLGFSYNRLKNFNKKYSMKGANQDVSLADYMAYRAIGYNNPQDLWVDNSYDPFANGIDWLAAFGYSSHMIEYKGDAYYEAHTAILNNKIQNRLFAEEKGSMNTYDFNMGTTFSDILSAGLTVSVTDIDYRLYSLYSEDIGTTVNGFDFFNWQKTEGTGWQVKAGLILKPIQELRIGVSYHSPTWYNMTDYSRAEMDYEMSDYIAATNNPKGTIYTGDLEMDYKLRTPDKWTFSLAGVIGQLAIVSLDYELSNYKNMKLHDRYGNPLADSSTDPNNFIKSDFRTASTVRVGAEVRVTPQFSARVGYAWMQSPLEKSFKNNDFEVMNVGSVAHYTLDGDLNNFTYGLGYKFSRNFYTDVAFVMSSQKSDLYAFPKGFNANEVEKFAPAKTSLKTNRFQGLLTLGYKF